MTLLETMQADIAFATGDLGSEPALYLPDGGAARPINVVIDRESEAVNAAPRAALSTLAVFACNCATTGISGDELAPTDQIRLAKVRGGDHVVMRIVRMRDETPASIELEVSL